MTDEKQAHPYIDYLYSLTTDQKRGALADLRRGLSEPPGTSAPMFPYIARWVPERGRNAWIEKVYYLVAALFAYYQSGGGTEGKRRLTSGNFGDHCQRAFVKEARSGSFEARFTTLLKAHPEDLPVILRQMVSLLKSADIAINWDQLFYDLTRWNSETKYIQRQWANSFWAGRQIEEAQHQEESK